MPLESLLDDGRGISYGIVQPGSPVPDGIPIVRVSDVRSGRIATADPLRVSPAIEAAYSRTRLKGGELLLTLVGTVGEAAIVPDSLNGWNTARAVAVIPVRKEIGSYWVQTALQAPEVREIIHSRLNTTVQATLNLRDVAQLPIVLPPRAEREAIAHILGTLDDKIELNRRMSETLESIARALFQSWFVNFDPVRAKSDGRAPGLPKHIADLFPDSFEESELGEIPKGWTTSAVYDLATYINGATYSAFEPNDERRGLPIIKIAELKAGVTAQTRFSTVEMPEKYRIDTGDLLFSWSGNPDTSIDTFVWTHGPAWLNQHIFRVVPQSPHERAFVLTILKHLRPVFAEIARNKQTTGLGHVTSGDLKQLLVARPPESILLAWNMLVDPVASRSLCLELESNAVSVLRDALLPKLMSGEMRRRHSDSGAAGAGR